MQIAIELPDELFFDIQNSLKQQDIKQFVLEAVKYKLLQEQQAQQNSIIEQGAEFIKLSQQQQQDFVESLLNPKPCNEKLKRAAQAYKNEMGL